MANDDGEAPPVADRPERTSPIPAIAKAVAGLTNGKRAQLRRIYLTGRLEADGLVMGLLHGADVSVRPEPEALRPWKLLVHCAALLSGTGREGAPSHASDKPLGAALHAAGISEDRLLRLTSARDRMQDSLVVQAMRRVERENKGPVNLRTLFDLIRYADDERGAAARLRIARDFYAAEARSEKGSSNDD